MSDAGTRKETQSVLEALRHAVTRHCHEVRQPLLGIKGYAELMADAPEDGALLREGARQINAQADRVARMLDELLALFLGTQVPRGTPASEASTPPAPPLERALGLYRRRLPERVTVELDVPAGLPDVAITSDHLEQIAVNLISNALDAVASVGGGRIELRARKSADGQAVRIECADDGPGVPAALRDALFAPYCTGKPPGRGTGLGLAISRELAQRAGGSLELDDEAARAWPRPVTTVFRLTLPTVR